MNKPTLISRQEFADNLVKLINESGVPLFVLQPVLDQVRNDVAKAVEQQYLKEKAAYEQSLKESEVENGEDN